MVIKEGSLLESQAQTLVNPVNCTGIACTEVAHAFRKQYPDMHQDYIWRCMQRELYPGHLHAYYDISGRVILSFPTKDHYREPSMLDWIDAGLLRFRMRYEDMGVRSIAFPALGCDQGDLRWSDVFPLMKEHLDQLPIYTEIYIPT